MTDPYRAARQLERKIFRGVPEQPEPNAERDRNAHVPERLTGSSQLSDRRLPAAGEGWTLVATVIYNRDAGEVRYVPAQSKADETGAHLGPGDEVGSQARRR